MFPAPAEKAEEERLIRLAENKKKYQKSSLQGPAYLEDGVVKHHDLAALIDELEREKEEEEDNNNNNSDINNNSNNTSSSANNGDNESKQQAAEKSDEAVRLEGGGGAAVAEVTLCDAERGGNPPSPPNVNDSAMAITTTLGDPLVIDSTTESREGVNKEVETEGPQPHKGAEENVVDGSETKETSGESQAVDPVEKKDGVEEVQEETTQEKGQEEAAPEQPPPAAPEPLKLSDLMRIAGEADYKTGQIMTRLLNEGSDPFAALK